MVKKDPYKFTIQFNGGDPSHLQIAEMLNQQGRRKAQFIVNAVMHYIHCSVTPHIPEPVIPDTEMIEKVVLRILEEQEKKNNKQEKRIETVEERPIKTEDIVLEDAAEMLGEDGMAAIAKTMARLRV